MKMDRQKFEIARARACMSQADFEAAGIPKGTLCRAMSGRGLKPETLGKIAKVLNVDVTQIMK
ncbi:MAG: helix-turn-helix domain-containing protein [Lachnospiraceae bacterium]|nr:helix-turn-helix domain-containing protein [Lachnospiraceae bacterium]